MFFSRQRGDLVDFRCLGAQGARFEAKFGAHRPEPKLSFSRCPGSLWALLELFQRLLSMFSDSRHHFASFSWSQTKGSSFRAFRAFRPTAAAMVAQPGRLHAKPSNRKTLHLSDGREFCYRFALGPFLLNLPLGPYYLE